MARLPRLSAPGWPHLLILQGHNRQAVFLDAVDVTLYRQLLKESAATAGVAILAYGLLGNEVQLLVTPTDAQGISRMMQGLGRRYGAAFNRRHSRTGGLWEGRFRSTVIEPEQHLLSCMRFIEEVSSSNREAVSEGDASSAAHHLGHCIDSLVSDHPQYWALGNTPFERQAAYRHLLTQTMSAAERALIRGAVLKSWPLGTPRFLEALAEHTSRRLAPLRRGRPRKL